jgi:hypothetical protein
MANTKPYEIIAGPLDVYYAAEGTPFPTMDDSDESIKDGGTWTYIGYTEGGVKVAHPQTIIEHRADQVTAPVKATRSEEGLEITFDIASLKLDNYALALNRALEGARDDGGSASVPLYRGGFQVETFAFIARQGHLSPYGDKPLQYQVPVVFQAESPEATYTKDNKAVLACSLHALADPERSDDDEAFGRIVGGK